MRKRRTTQQIVPEKMRKSGQMLFDGELKIKKGIFTPQMRYFYFLFALSSSLINQQLNKILGTLKKSFFDIFIIEIVTKNIQAPGCRDLEL